MGRGCGHGIVSAPSALLQSVRDRAFVTQYHCCPLRVFVRVGRLPMPAPSIALMFTCPIAVRLSNISAYEYRATLLAVPRFFDRATDDDPSFFCPPAAVPCAAGGRRGLLPSCAPADWFSSPHPPRLRRGAHPGASFRPCSSSSPRSGASSQIPPRQNQTQSEDPTRRLRTL